MTKTLPTLGAAALGALVIVKIFEADATQYAISEVMQFATYAIMACFAVPVIIALVGSALFGYMWWQKQRNNHLRRRDGAFALQVVKLREGRVAYIDMNEAAGPVVIADKRRGVIEEPEPGPGWAVQVAIKAITERTRQAQAVFPGDQVRDPGSKPPSLTAATGRFLGGNYDKPPQLPAPDGDWRVMEEPEPESAEAALRNNTAVSWAMGTGDEGGTPVRWNVVTNPHLRVHGSSQGSGKTNLLRTIAAGALMRGAHLLVLDHRRFKDWHDLSSSAELVDTTDTGRFAQTMQRLYAMFSERDQMLANAGAHNIAQIDGQRRVLVIISEFGALCRNADVDGNLDTAMHPLSQMLRQAGSAGIHFAFEDQSPEGWDRGIIVNATPVAGKTPLNYGSTVGYHHAHKLDPYQFHFERQTFRTWDMQQTLPRLTLPSLNGFRVVDGETVHGPVHNSRSQPFAPEVTPPSSAPMNGMNGTTFEPKWREFTDRWFEQNPAYISEPYGGISALARAMAAEDGGNDHNAYKSTAKQYFDAFLTEVNAWAKQTTKD